MRARRLRPRLRVWPLLGACDGELPKRKRCTPIGTSSVVRWAVHANEVRSDGCWSTVDFATDSPLPIRFTHPTCLFDDRACACVQMLDPVHRLVRRTQRPTQQSTRQLMLATHDLTPRWKKNPTGLQRIISALQAARTARATSLRCLQATACGVYTLVRRSLVTSSSILSTLA